jgi:hypothetical protein
MYSVVVSSIQYKGIYQPWLPQTRYAFGPMQPNDSAACTRMHPSARISWYYYPIRMYYLSTSSRATRRIISRTPACQSVLVNYTPSERRWSRQNFIRTFISMLPIHTNVLSVISTSCWASRWLLLLVLPHSTRLHNVELCLSRMTDIHAPVAHRSCAPLSRTRDFIQDDTGMRR